jgi:hypothetical protein
MVVEMMWPVTGSPPSSLFCTTRKKTASISHGRAETSRSAQIRRRHQIWWEKLRFLPSPGRRRRAGAERPASWAQAPAAPPWGCGVRTGGGWGSSAGERVELLAAAVLCAAELVLLCVGDWDGGAVLCFWPVLGGWWGVRARCGFGQVVVTIFRRR